jgi:hypothetical protein
LTTDFSEVRTASNNTAMMMMMAAERTSETSVDNYFIRQYNPEDKSKHNIISLFVAITKSRTQMCIAV